MSILVLVDIKQEQIIVIVSITLTKMFLSIVSMKLQEFPLKKYNN